MFQLTRQKLKVIQYLQAILPMILLLLIILGVGMIWFIPSLQQMHIDLRKRLSKDLVRSAWSLAQALEQQVQLGQLTEEEAQDLFLEQILTLRYGQDMKDYYWVHKTSGEIVAHPYTATGSVDLSKHMALNGKPVLDAMDDIVKSPAHEGFVEYNWQWKDANSRDHKISFVKLFEPWELVIGSGFYLRDTRMEFEQLSNNFAKWLIIFGLVLTVLILLIIRKTIHHSLLLSQKDNEIRTNERRFSNMADYVDHGIAIFQDRELAFCNKRLCDMIGTSFDKVGQKENQDSTKVSQLFASFKQAVHGVQENSGNQSLDMEYPISDDKTRFLSLRCTHNPEDQQSYLLVFDRTDTRLQEQELYRLSKIIRECPLSVIITDTNGLIEFANRFTGEVSGYSTTEMLGKKTSMFKSDQMPQNVYEDLWTTVGRGETWTGELLNRHKNGSLFWEYAVIAPLKNSHGEIERYFSIKADISNLKSLERELMMAKGKAEESDRVKSTFLNSISHEIRTPLNAITGVTGYLFNELPDNEDFRSCRTMIDDSVQTFINLLNDLIYLSELRKDEVFADYDYGNVDNMLEDVLKQFTADPDIKPKEGIEVLTDFDPAFENKLIFTDSKKLKQLLREFLSNASKFTEAGSITLGYRLDGDTLVFFVKDTGKGISEEDKPHVFKMFYHGNTHFVTQHKGTGVGLNLALEISSLMGGKIWFESDLNRGTTFYVSGVCNLQ